MSTPLLIQNAATSVVVYLEDSATGLPATGLTFADVTAGIKKEGAASFIAFPLTALNFSDLLNGFYEVDLTSADTDTLGSLYLSFTGATIKNALVVARVAVAATAPPVPPIFTPTVTTIFGYIYDLGGNPISGASVLAHVMSVPTLIHPSTQGIAIGSEIVTTVTDSTGFFSLDLIEGITVEILIAAANYRRTILVPGTNVNLFDIP